MSRRPAVLIEKEPALGKITTSQQSGNGDTDLTFSHTLEAATYPLNHLIFVVLAHSRATETISSVAWGAVSLSQVNTQTVEAGITDIEQQVWVGAPSGVSGAQNVVITFTGAFIGARCQAIAFGLQNCSVVVSDTPSVKSQATSGTSISNSITTVSSRAFLFDIVSSDGTGSTEHVLGSQQILMGSWVETVQDFETSISYRRTTTFGPQTLSRSWTTSDANGQIVVAIRPM